MCSSAVVAVLCRLMIGLPKKFLRRLRQPKRSIEISHLVERAAIAAVRCDVAA